MLRGPRAPARAAGLLLLLACVGCERVCVPEVALGGPGGGGGLITAALNIPTYPTAERQDVRIDWSGLTSDMDCAPLDPVGDIDVVALIRFPSMGHEDVARALAVGTVNQSDTNGYVSCEPGLETACILSEFRFGGVGYDMVSTYEQAAGSFLLGFSTGTEPAIGGNRSLAFLAPTPGSEVLEVMVEPACPMAEVSVDLGGGEPLLLSAEGTATDPVAADSGVCVESTGASWPISWSELTTSAAGSSVTPASIDLVVVARYAMPVSDLEARFSERDTIAAEWYSLPTEGRDSADLAYAVASTGLGSFSGFSGEGVWLLELRQGSSFLNLPVFVTVVEST